MEKKIDYTYKYKRDFDEDTPKLLEYLFNGGSDQSKIKEMCKQGLHLIENLYDCSDFRIEIFTRILYGYKKIIGQEVENLILSSLLNFPFEDNSCHSMCTWTENHQLIINVNEYLLGNMYPDAIFYNNKLGSKLSSDAYTRLNDWCDLIYRFGFSEFGSGNYYPETLAALGNIIEFSKDDKLRNKFKIILDLICFDIFSSITPDLTYNKATARAYVDNKINYYNYLKPHILSLLNKEVKINHEREACFFLMLKALDKNNKPLYQLPKVFLDIFNSKEKLLKESNGLNANEYLKNDLLKYSEKNINYIMTSGTSGSYVANKNFVRYLNEKNMWNHAMFSFIKPYRQLLGHTPKLVMLLRKTRRNNYEDISYARGNTYTYVKNNYSISSLTRYQVDKPSFQQVSNIINLDGLNVFTTSPARKMNELGSPNYWVGSKINPDCIQYKNILITYYKNPKQTHLFFPIEKFEKVNLDYIYKGFIFGRYHDINIAIRTNNNLQWVDSTNDLSIKGDEKIKNFILKKYDLLNTSAEDHYYIFEVEDTLSFEKFIEDVLDNSPLIRDNQEISYKNIKYSFKQKCFYKNEIIKTNYYRYESEFVKNGKYIYSKNNPLIFISKHNKLIIDFDNFTRSEEEIK